MPRSRSSKGRKPWTSPYKNPGPDHRPTGRGLGPPYAVPVSPPVGTPMMRSPVTRGLRGLFCGLVLGLTPAPARAQPAPIKVLFLGDNGHHKPMERYRLIEPVL